MRVMLLHEDTREPGQGGGGESLLRDQTEALKRRGHQVAWLHDAQIARAVDAFKPDIVHVSTIHNFVGFEPARWLQEQRIPHVWAINDYWPFCVGRMLLTDWIKGNSCAAVDGICNGKCSKGASPAEWLQLVNGSPVVAYNEHTAAIYRRNGLRCDYVVELGVDVDRFKPDPTQRTPEPSVWASSAWPEYPVKGLPVLQGAIAGTGWQVNYMAHTTRDNIALGLKRAHVYVFPSIYQETWGLSLNEAMASGCACIASDVAGARAQLHDGLGLLVPPRDPQALRQALEWLLAHPREREQMGARARAHVLADHTLEAMGQRWLAVYQAVINGVRVPR